MVVVCKLYKKENVGWLVWYVHPRNGRLGVGGELLCCVRFGFSFLLVERIYIYILYVMVVAMVFSSFLPLCSIDRSIDRPTSPSIHIPPVELRTGSVIKNKNLGKELPGGSVGGWMDRSVASKRNDEAHCVSRWLVLRFGFRSVIDS
ncbi:unnamed protein product [Pseudo-nitzschia multistriata]|uniref:Transmembrane protein n=1 Tax=Pseudo-nitzschia multistriata TaxID=183589 RepID=A0A448Z7T6_9STRA|nr:unnamed protein product [Pseudo-nitzschia multistriata]